MASIFTYQEEPPRIHSPWATPGTATPQPLLPNQTPLPDGQNQKSELRKLAPENQEGPTEYKLHLLLRPRRRFISISTSTSIPHPDYVGLQSISSGSRSTSDPTISRSVSVQPTTHARQTRLQQLTTQLLWRLQQSSPFHSSSNADLVLPILPEATPRLGIPERPAKLLPGLEESQGALYEIGVADDGTLVGLVEDELQESLTNLRAMAASLGCTTSILRKVAVGYCQWSEDGNEGDILAWRTDQLWVAEVLVYPDSNVLTEADVPTSRPNQSSNLSAPEDGTDDGMSCTEQLRVTLVGATAAGKSSLLGTLSTSTLDNGRGKSRLSLLKHRHELASGVTSSVAQEIIGYARDRTASPAIVNYASGNVSSWIDIHNLAHRLVFLSDSPGIPRFAKSTLRSLISWKPAWTILCVGADSGESNAARTGTSSPRDEPLAQPAPADNMDLSLSYLDLCLNLGTPLIICITKIDLANRSGLRVVLARLLSALKAAGRKPVMVNFPPSQPLVPDAAGSHPALQSISTADQAEVDRVVSTLQGKDGFSAVPILMTSAVTGLGIGGLHALLRSLPDVRPPVLEPCVLTPSSLFHVDEVFSIPPSRVYSSDFGNRVVKEGVVLCGYVARGTLSVGSVMYLGPISKDQDSSSKQPARLAARSCSYGNETVGRDSAGMTTKLGQSYQGEGSRSPGSRTREFETTFLPVRIVSLRNLRLPVVGMQQGDTGTIGVELLNDDTEGTMLERARKGMVLLGDSGDISLAGYRLFSASFELPDFARQDSPPLILGGHATVYINSIRAAVKVVGVALDEGATEEETAASSEGEVFRFDMEDIKHMHGDGNRPGQKGIKLTFRFVSTVEWMEKDNQVLVIPTVVAPGPVSGPAVSHTSGLAGFVGRVCEVYT
ncbi:hypothetical protein HRR83_005133 [Exophiala dermatitidis]|uniref:Tr-type G domain-containing protein n=1 Tax=Exophiala dermatitidis TaxID=5970 RepID=A0AAN6IUQ3_EXODE|nr:hypothetical protein HRR75_004301 [Exophiala dermatitidis]KAJ4516953.1 hypothetical protein HRR74_004702 [Exophiala dermatitidis]KAJ4519868.1 hypothetical protein HRR73_003929 [Exophiala dermatitidis]KAJ4534323.1 hypothetical protein HRR76_006251 [Exophiala dermatitidis]KAJ4541455.1 hypothetical protein HRR77_006247 [Exophiala dermatitidis]